MPKTERKGRIHSSTVVVVVMPEIPFDFKIDEKDIYMEKFRAGGPGGQHVNKTESAVRLTHKPTGLTVSIQDERSQWDNMVKGLKTLKMKVYMKEYNEYNIKIMEGRQAQLGEGSLSERIRTYNWPDDRVTDHRLKWTMKGVDNIVNGKLLEEFMEELIKRDHAKQLETIMNI